MAQHKQPSSIASGINTSIHTLRALEIRGESHPMRLDPAPPPLQAQPGVSPYNFRPSTHPGVIMNPSSSPHDLTSENSIHLFMSSLPPLPEANARVHEYINGPC